MKKIYLFLLFCTIHTYSQTEFKFDKNGLTPDFVVLKYDTIGKKTLYTKSINWIKETYKSPDEVINSKIENEKIFIEGISQNSLSIGGGAKLKAKYSIEIAFKDGKIKFDPIVLDYYTKEYGWNKIYIDSKAKNYYKKSGKVRGLYKQLIIDIPEVFNSLMQELNNYILDKKESSNDDW